MRGLWLRSSAFSLVVSLAASATSGAQLVVGSGSSLSLGSNSLDLGCAALLVEGTVDLGSGLVARVLDLGIAPAGALHGQSGALRVTRDWANSGTFDAGIGTVELVDGCGAGLADILGDTTFAGLSMTTSTGKEHRFAAGSTQTVTTALTLAGVSRNLLRIRSSVDGSEALLDLQGSQSIAFVDVKDNHAVGVPLQLGPESFTSGNALGWRLVSLVPALSPISVGLLALAFLWSTRRILVAHGGS